MMKSPDTILNPQEGILQRDAGYCQSEGALLNSAEKASSSAEDHEGKGLLYGWLGSNPGTPRSPRTWETATVSAYLRTSM